MKFFIIMSMMSLSLSANAASLKSMVCENADFKVQVEVLAEANEATVVAWNITNKATEDSERFMGYLHSEGSDLKKFSSVDLGSELEVNGQTATVTGEDFIANLICK